MRVPRVVFSSVAVIVLFVCSVAAAHAVTIEFFGTRDSFNGAPPGPNPTVCGTDLFLQIPTGPGDSNLGAFTHNDSHCVAAGNVFNGVFNWDFGLGDTLTGIFSGTFQPPNFTEMFTITGGTGRFADAIGSFLGTGTVEFIQGAGANTHMDFEGVITTVPEPSTLGLLVLCLAGLALVRRRSVPGTAGPAAR
jgi:PEP-CTERM motif